MADNEHGTVFDTGLQYLGTVYAKALVAAGEKAGTTETILAELDSLISDVLDRMPKFEATLASPRVPHETKDRLLDRAFQGKMSVQTLNFLKVLARRGRFQALRAVRVAAQRLFNDLRGRIEVRLTTAEPLDDALRGYIVDKLRQSLERDVDLKTQVDAELVGGMVIRIGDTVYDGSLANQLERLRGDLVTRAAQTLRSQSDRFTVA